MAMSTTTIYLSFLLASLLLLQSTSADKNFIIKTCNSTSVADLCIKTLLSDPQSLNISSIDGLAVIALNIAIRSAESAGNYAQDMYDSGKYDGMPEQTAFGECASSYGEAADYLRDAQMDLPKKEFSAAEDLAGQAQDGAEYCERAFADQNVKSLMTGTNKMVGDQCGLCWDIVFF
ncbi:hypothetical protein LUZ60_009829 [Juncus effusus]|nr:hypothetical protein LUZ60_009829 [Juncus effusus]